MFQTFELVQSWLYQNNIFVTVCNVQLAYRGYILQVNFLWILWIRKICKRKIPWNFTFGRGVCHNVKFAKWVVTLVFSRNYLSSNPFTSQIREIFYPRKITPIRYTLHHEIIISKHVSTNSILYMQWSPFYREYLF